MPTRVADALREAILDGVLEPGAWLREAEIARELNVSRTPVRDAFPHPGRRGPGQHQRQPGRRREPD